MAKVPGTLVVTGVKINMREAFDALVVELGLARLLEKDRDSFWRVEETNGVKSLVHYIDQSYHGSPSYVRSSVKPITDPDKIRLYELFKEMKSLITIE